MHKCACLQLGAFFPRSICQQGYRFQDCFRVSSFYEERHWHAEQAFLISVGKAKLRLKRVKCVFPS